MAEHTPAPTPDRAVYGFALYLLFYSLFIVYVIWAFVPQSILEDRLGLTYLPDKYFALYIPILILCGTTFFAFFIYPGMNMSLTPDIYDPRTMRDSFSISRCQFYDADGRKCDNQVPKSLTGWQIPKFCSVHDETDNEPRSEQEKEISESCDCPAQHRCLLRENSEHVQQLRSRTKVPSVSDLDMADVCEQIFGG